MPYYSQALLVTPGSLLLFRPTVTMTTNMLTLDQLIVHKIDHHNDDAPQLSDLPTPVDEAVTNFVRGHIIANREHKNARTASFVPPQDGKTSFQALADQLLDEPESFVTASQEMARHLFVAVQNDRRISASDLFVCAFRESNVDGRQLALLKMEPQDSLVGDFERVDGKQRIVLTAVENILPTGDLQKSAFILPQAERERRKYDLRVVDQQIARFGARRPVASFFTGPFLQCQIGLNSADLTNRFVYGSYQWLRTVEKDWPPIQTAVFKEQVRLSLLANQVDLTTFAAATIVDPEQQADYLNTMVEQGIDQLVFAPDPAERDRWAARVSFLGDNDLRVTIDAGAVGPNRTLDAVFDPALGLWTVTITTTTWEENLVK